MRKTNLTLSSGISSITELHQAGVVLEGFAFNPDDIEQNIIEMPLNMKSMQDHALEKRHWASRKPLSVWDAFARLPNYQQEILLKFIVKRKKELYGYTGDNHPQSPQLVLISLHVAKHRSQRFLEALKRFRNFDIRNGPKRSTLFIVVARVTGPFTNGPEPLISSMTPGHSPSNGGGLRRDDSYYSDSILSNSPSQISSRSHRRSRTRHSRSHSRSRTRGGLAIAAVAGALLAAYKERKRRKLTQDRRSRSRARSRSRSRRYTSYSSSPYSTPPSSPPPPPAEKSGDQANDEPQLGRITTLNEIDENDQSDLPPPPPQLGSYPPPPQRQRTTTSRKDADQDRKSIGEQALAALHSRSISHGGRDVSRVNEGGETRRNTLAKPSRDARIARDTRSRRDRSRSRSRDRSSSRAVVQRRKTWARSSSSENRLGRRYKHVQRPMQLHRKSPERPILRTYTDDGVPPTQRDKAAVAEYYLKKWTTAYDSVRAQNRDRKRATVRSRSRSRSRGVREPGLVEYGDAPVYGDQAYYSHGYYPPPTAERGYNDSDPYRSSYNPLDHPPPLGAAASTDRETRKQGKREEREKRRRQEIESYDMDANAHQNAHTYSPRPTSGTIHSVNTDDEEKVDHGPIRLPTGLAAPTNQRAYAESVPDNGNERP